jgi:hypothetical protein
LSAVAHIKDYKTGKFYRDEFRGDISWNGYEHNVLLRNEGTKDNSAHDAAQEEDGTLEFTDVAMATGADDIKDDRGVATADFDNDGDLDIFINTNPGDSGDPAKAHPVLLRNNVGQQRNWLAVELEGTGSSNRDAVGAMVTIETKAGKQLRLVTAGSSFASQQSSRLYFGLDRETQVNAITVLWPDGRAERFEQAQGQALTARQLVRITEAKGIEAHALPAK